MFVDIGTWSSEGVWPRGIPFGVYDILTVTEALGVDEIIWRENG